MDSACSGLKHGGTEPSVDVVIVNWNSRELLRECLAALDQSINAENVNVIVVDNASTDGSADGLAAVRINFEVVRNADNRGFASACNQGAAKGKAPYLLFLNPDVRVRTDTVESTTAYLNDPDNSRAGIVGAQLLDSDGHIQRSCARKPTAASLLLHTMFLDRIFPRFVPPHFLVTWDHHETRDVDQVMGAYLMIRRGLFTSLGGFDERFFLYYEDLDLCVAAREAGSTVVYYTGAGADHAGGGTTAAIKNWRLFYVTASRIRYARKRHGRTVALVLIVLSLLIEMPIRCIRAVIASPFRHPLQLPCAMVLIFGRFVES